MAQQNKEDTLTGGKVYSPNLGRAGIPGTIPGITKPEMLGDSYREGTSGSPDDQGGVSPFGKTDVGGPHIT